MGRYNYDLAERIEDKNGEWDYAFLRHGISRRAVVDFLRRRSEIAYRGEGKPA